MSSKRANNLEDPNVTRKKGPSAVGTILASAQSESVGILSLNRENFTIIQVNPAAARSLRFAGHSIDNASGLSEPIRAWLRRCLIRIEADGAPEGLHLESPSARVQLSMLDNQERNELLLVVTENEVNRGPGRLMAFGLTKREAEVLHWIALGKTSFEIAVILGVASSTVDKHADRILTKLAVDSRASAAAEVRVWDSE